MTRPGIRKTIAFYNVFYASLILAFVAMLSGKVTFSGEEILNLINSLVALSITFFVANVGEHFAKRSKAPANEQ